MLHVLLHSTRVLAALVSGYEKYGIEDPRLIAIDNQVYLSYVVLSDYVTNGQASSSTALATTDDFHNHRRLGIITSIGSDNKDVVLFPEKINQKYLALHRPFCWVGSKFELINQVSGFQKVTHYQILKNTRCL